MSMERNRTIYCCQCEADVMARLTDGAEIYPHRKDLAKLPFWICDACGNSVGCHHKTAHWWAPLGCIPSPEIRRYRKLIHARMDGVWKSGQMARGDLYQAVSDEVGWQFHAAKIRTIEQAKAALEAVEKIARL
jgi:hypothetical protein